MLCRCKTRHGPGMCIWNKQVSRGRTQAWTSCKARTLLSSRTSYKRRFSPGLRNLLSCTEWESNSPREKLAEKIRCGEAMLGGSRIGVGSESARRGRGSHGEIKAILRCARDHDETHANIFLIGQSSTPSIHLIYSGLRHDYFYTED